jgi:Histidine kinase
MDIAVRTRPARRQLPSLAAFVWNAWRGITSAQVGYAILFWLAWGLSMGVNQMVAFPRYAPWEPIATGLYDAFIVASLLLLGLALADAYPPSQTRRWLPYAVAALVANMIGTVLLVFTEPLFGLHCCWNEPRPPDYVFVVVQFGANVVICTLATVGYYQRRRALQRAQALRTAQLARGRLARRAFEARLQAMQARVEPQFLFNTLAQVERLYEVDADRADRMLDDLIVYLRAALPQLRETTSSLAREFELATAYLNVVGAGMGDRMSVDTSALDDGPYVKIPPMVILPLIEYALAHRLDPLQADGWIRIVARVESGKLVLIVTDTSARSEPDNAGGPTLQGIRERLVALYGKAAGISLVADGNSGFRAVVKIPDERTDDRGHR